MIFWFWKTINWVVQIVLYTAMRQSWDAVITWQAAGFNQKTWWSKQKLHVNKKEGKKTIFTKAWFCIAAFCLSICFLWNSNSKNIFDKCIIILLLTVFKCLTLKLQRLSGDLWTLLLQNWAWIYELHEKIVFSFSLSSSSSSSSAAFPWSGRGGSSNNPLFTLTCSFNIFAFHLVYVG